MKSSGRLFRVFIGILLLGVFVELFVIIGILVGEADPKGDVAVVEVRGVIEDPMEPVRRIKRFRENDRVKAIVLRVDSPGGAIGGSQEIYEAVLQAKARKKVVVSMGNLAASGGYYISAAADRIVAAPGTLTGSIGVILEYPVVEELLKRLSLRWETVQSGDHKATASPFRSLRPEERRLLQATLDDVHGQFIEAVAEGRKMEMEEVRKIADGRILSGREALKTGLVDELGGLERAIEVAASLAGIPGKPKVIYPERERFVWLKRLAEGKIETGALRLEYRPRP